MLTRKNFFFFPGEERTRDVFIEGRSTCRPYNPLGPGLDIGRSQFALVNAMTYGLVDAEREVCRSSLSIPSRRREMPKREMPRYFKIAAEMRQRFPSSPSSPRSLRRQCPEAHPLQSDAVNYQHGKGIRNQLR